MILPMTVLEPSEIIRPTNTEIPWNTPESAPRQVWINHDYHKSVEQEPYDMESRYGPVGVETVYFQSLRVNLRCQITQTFYHIPDGSLMKCFHYICCLYIFPS